MERYPFDNHMEIKNLPKAIIIVKKTIFSFKIRVIFIYKLIIYNYI